MTRRWVGFEGLANGTTWNAANSGGAAGTAITSQTGGASATASTAQCMHGTRSLLINASANQGYSSWTGLSAASAAIRFYLRLNSGTNTLVAAQDIASFSGGPKLQLSATRQLKVIDQGGAAVQTWNALALDTWYRIELYSAKGASSSTGTIQAAYYLGDSTTPVQTQFLDTSANAGTSNVTAINWGKLTGGSVALSAYIDDVDTDDAATGFLGPLTSTARTDAWSWNVYAQGTPATAAWSWAVLAQATKTAAWSWQTFAQVSKTAAWSWGVRQQVSKTAAWSWNVLTQGTPKTAAWSWAVAAQVTKTAAWSWAVASRPVKTAAWSWGVLAQGTPKTAAWSWAVRQQQVATYPWSWNTAGQPTAVFGWSWAVLEERTKTAAWSWAVRQQAAKTVAWSWAVRQQQATSSGWSWAVRQQQVKTAGWSWAVAARSTKTTAWAWAVRQQLVKTTAWSWDVVAAAGGSRVVIFEVGAETGSLTADSKVVIFEVGAMVGNGAPLDVSIVGPSMVEAFGDVTLQAVVAGGIARSYLWQVLVGPTVEATRADDVLEYWAPGARERITMTWRVTVDGMYTAEHTVTTYQGIDAVLTDDGWEFYGVRELRDA